MMDMIDQPLDKIFSDARFRGVKTSDRGAWSQGRRRRKPINGKRRRQSWNTDRNSPEKRSRIRKDNISDSMVSLARERNVYVHKLSKVKRLAGKVAYDLRESFSPTIFCTGKVAINQAVKTLAIARTYLAEDDLDFKIYPEFQVDKDRHDSIYFLVIPANNRIELSTDNAIMLTSSEKAKAGKIGGKIAHSIRDGKRVLGQGVGPNAVWRFVQSLLIAKDCLKENNLDLSFRVEFVVNIYDDEEVNAIRFFVYAEQI